MCRNLLPKKITAGTVLINALLSSLENPELVSFRRNGRRKMKLGGGGWGVEVKRNGKKSDGGEKRNAVNTEDI